MAVNPCTYRADVYPREADAGAGGQTFRVLPGHVCQTSYSALDTDTAHQMVLKTEIPWLPEVHNHPNGNIYLQIKLTLILCTLQYAVAISMTIWFP